MRKFYVKEEGKQRIEYTGLFSYGRLNAARDYAKDMMPGWIVLSGGNLVAIHNGESVYCLECINHDQSMGARLWVYEPY